MILFFLDIYMNGINGMETARKIRLWDTSCHIIFVTTLSDFAVDSYEVKATYYLIKPNHRRTGFGRLWTAVICR